MTNITRPGLEYSQDLAEEKLKEFRSGTTDLHAKIDSTMVLLSTLIYEMTEADLRDYLTIAGVDLTEWEQFETAQDIVSWFAVAGAIVLYEPFQFSLLDLQSPLAMEHVVNDAMDERMVKIKSDGLFYRMTMEPEM